MGSSGGLKHKKKEGRCGEIADQVPHFYLFFGRHCTHTPQSQDKMAVATAASAVLAPPPNMQLWAKMREKNQEAARGLGTRLKDVCISYRTGGADIPAIVISKKEPGEWNQSFMALALNTHGIADPKFFSDETFQAYAEATARFDLRVQTGQDIRPTDTSPVIVARVEDELKRIDRSKCIVLEVQAPGERSKNKPSPEQLASKPPCRMICSFKAEWFSATPALMRNVHPGDVVTLKSVYCNGGVPMRQRVVDGQTLPAAADHDWGKFLNVGAVEPARGLTLSDIYAYTLRMEPTYLMPCDMTYDITNPDAVRYGNTPIILHVNKTPVTEAQRVYAMADPVWQKPPDQGDWSFEKAGEKDRVLCAQLRIKVQQWLGQVVVGQEENLLVGVSLYSEHIGQFGIDNEPQWFSIAPPLFKELEFSVMGVLDYKATQEKYAGVEQDSAVSFAAHIKPNLFIANTRLAYTTIGIPVTPKFVREHFELAQAPLKDADKFRVLTAPNVLSLEGETFKSLRSAFAAYAEAEPDRIEFRVLLGLELVPSVKERIADMTPEFGAQFVKAAKRPDTSYSADDNGDAFPEDVVALRGNITQVEHIAVVVITHFDFGAKANAERKNQVLSFLGTGEAPPRAIENGSASASDDAAAAGPLIEEVPEEKEEEVQEQQQQQPPPAKSSKKRSGKSKSGSKPKRSRTEA